jgi:two-component system probable response regulator PhcQ
MSGGYDYKKYAVLYVDDEVQSLKYFPKLFGDTFRCLTAESVAKAREVLAKEGDTIGVVISDQRMPGETGVDLLSWLRGARPQVTRVLTTAHSDLDSAIEAVNSGAIFRYVVKPWEDRDLRGVLLRAMEFHMVQRERDLLLREKLATLQRIVVMDRVRSFAVLAAGLANRIKNPLVALKTFLESAPAHAQKDAEDSHLQWGDLWDMAQKESQRVLELVQSVVRRTTEPDYRFAPGVRLETALAPALARARQAFGNGASLTVDPGTPAIIADRAMLERMFDSLVGRVMALGIAGGSLSLTASGGATVWGAAGVRVSVRAGAKEWTQQNLADLFAALSPRPGQEAETDLLSAYFAAYHHSGNLAVHLAPPSGPGFEVQLPLDPTAKGELPLERDWVESIFSFPET